MYNTSYITLNIKCFGIDNIQENKNIHNRLATHFSYASGIIEIDTSTYC